jgi:GNAT superfamily N-acetyltransferase
MLTGAVGLAKIKALAAAETARGRGIGASLLRNCHQVYDRCGYLMLYGQMPPTQGLETFYRRAGFDVLAPGAPIDLWVIFGIHSHIQPGADERIFIRTRFT